MDKIPCNIIRDLMVLYDDESCSEESRLMIEEHIRNCPDCRKLCETAAKPLPEITMRLTDGSAKPPDDSAKPDVSANPPDDSTDTTGGSVAPGDSADTPGGSAVPNDSVDATAELMRRFSRNVQKRMQQKIARRVCLIVGILLCFGLCMHALWSSYLSTHINLVPAGDVRVTELYRLENGDIFCTLETDKPFRHSLFPDQKIHYHSSLRDGQYTVTLQYPLPSFDRRDKTMYRTSESFIFPVEGAYPDSTDEYGEPVTWSYTSIRYRGTGRDDTLIIWKESDHIPDAPDRIQERADKMYTIEEYGYIPEEIHSLDYDSPIAVYPEDYFEEKHPRVP